MTSASPAFTSVSGWRGFPSTVSGAATRPERPAATLTPQHVELIRWARERTYATPEVGQLVRAMPAAAAFVGGALMMSSPAQVEEAAVAREALLADALRVARNAGCDLLAVVGEYLGAFHRR